MIKYLHLKTNTNPFIIFFKSYIQEMILALSLCTIWNIIIKQILEQNTCNFKRKFLKKILLLQELLGILDTILCCGI